MYKVRIIKWINDVLGSEVTHWHSREQAVAAAKEIKDHHVKVIHPNGYEIYDSKSDSYETYA